jgi:hypothetical protein
MPDGANLRPAVSLPTVQWGYTKQVARCKRHVCLSLELEAEGAAEREGMG